MNPDAYLDFADRQISAPRKRILHAAEKRVATRAERAQAEQAEQLGAWRQWYRQREQALLAGEHADAARQLIGLLGSLTPEHADALIECAERFRSADTETRSLVLALADGAIVQMRQSHGLAPIDDPLPGAPDSVFLALRGMLS